MGGQLPMKDKLRKQPGVVKEPQNHPGGPPTHPGMQGNLFKTKEKIPGTAFGKLQKAREMKKNRTWAK